MGQSAAKYLNNMNIHNKWIPTKDELDQILTLYKYKSISAIAKAFKKDRSVIKRILVENNIHLKTQSEVHRLPVNEEFFKTIDTEEKAYWLGFIYADGYITKSGNTKVFGIKLGIKDISHLEKFKNTIKSEHKIIKETIYTKYGEIQACSLTMGNGVIVDSLIDKGVFFNKSKIIEPPTLNQVPQYLIRHFIRGYFDGDGSIYKTKAKKSYWKESKFISIVGTQQFLNWILDTLQNVCSTNTKVYKYNNKDVYELKIGGNANISKIYNYLYENSSVYLERKKERFLN